MINPAGSPEECQLQKASLNGRGLVNLRVTPYERKSSTAFWVVRKCLPVPWGSAAKQSNHGAHTTAANGLQLPSGSALSVGAENVRQAGGAGGVPPLPSSTRNPHPPRHYCAMIWALTVCPALFATQEAIPTFRPPNPLRARNFQVQKPLAPSTLIAGSPTC